MIDHLRHMVKVRPPGLDRDAAQWALAEIEQLRAATAMALGDLERTYCHVSSVSAARIKSRTIPALKAALAGKEGP